MTVAAIRVEDLSFRYAEAAQPALRGISFSVAPGETALILGPSGCGKSTLALCLNGLIPHLIEGEMTGEVHIWGKSTTAEPVAQLCRQVGEVFQDPEAQMVMPRVDEEIAFGLENAALPREQMLERIRAALGQVGLQDRLRAWIDELSGGQKQRLALAAVLALQPSILVLDEPTANLDPAATAAFFHTLARLKAELGMTLVLIEHRLDAVLPLVDRVIALAGDGRMLCSGAPREVFAQHAQELEDEGIWLPMTCRLTRALQSRGWTIDGGCPLTLDEVELAMKGEMAGLPPAVNARHADSPPLSPVSLRAETGSPAVEVDDLTFAYGGGRAILDRASLRIERGRFFALTGANGSGKTTLAKHLVGLLRPTQGRVAILGRDAQRQTKGELARQVGYVFQNPEHQFVTGRVADELAYSLRGRWSEDEISRRVARLVRTFGLEGYEDANPFALSQGQKRRLSVATMVALDQPILILDEPTFGQDQSSTIALMATLQDLHAAGTTIIFITHDMQLVAEYADEVAVLKAGRIIYQGDAATLFRRPDLMSQAELTAPPLADLGMRLGYPDLLTVKDWLGWADSMKNRVRLAEGMVQSGG